MEEWQIRVAKRSSKEMLGKVAKRVVKRVAKQSSQKNGKEPNRMVQTMARPKFKVKASETIGRLLKRALSSLEFNSDSERNDH